MSFLDGFNFVLYGFAFNWKNVVVVLSDRIETHDLMITNQMVYSTELQ